MPADEPFDVLIVGGGPVGVCLASALARAGFGVGLVEAAPARAPGADDRPLALSLGSRRILEGVGVWGAVAPQATPIRRVHVSQRGAFGVARLCAREHAVEALGYVVPAGVLQAALGRELRRGAGQVAVFAPATVEDAAVGVDAAFLEVRAGEGLRTLRARLVVAADGARSRLRGLLGIGARTRPYGQTALTARIEHERGHAHTAYERFTTLGPMALLPLAGDACGLVWSLPAGEAEHLLAIGEGPFVETLQREFGWRLGRVRLAAARRSYPLALVESREQVRRRVVLLGNAAHALHPVAAQGLNLGLRDAAALAEVVADALRAGRDPGALAALERYRRWREGDQRRVIRSTDALGRVLSAPAPPLAAVRGAGLLALDLVSPLKAGFARRAMGLAGTQPRLARGLAL